ncbi:DegV family EDD domain-containing protein [Lachnospiraceae bacterium 10-1]|jgi:DegV family protein with EDD domain|nr:DegV family EDD domain-containing protein [Lachnospiraceae bacterium 10-1]
MAIKIITDSASDITVSNREDLIILPITITFHGTEYQDGINLSHKEFYEKLIESEELPTTSQISPYTFEEAIRRVLADGDEPVIITLSGKLSGTYQNAFVAASEFEEKVYVIDSENVAVGQHALVEYALRLKDEGLDAASIAEELNKSKKRIHTIALLDTLEYLKKGGRISKAAAFTGSVLSIKPVVGVVNGEVAVLGKARGAKHGNNLLIEQIGLCGGIDFEKPFSLGYTGSDDTLIKQYIEYSKSIWEGHTDELPISTIGGTIGTHVGPGAVAVAFFSPE